MLQSPVIESTEKRDDGIIGIETEDEYDIIDPELAVDVLLMVAFECLDNLVHLEHHFKFLDLLHQLLEIKGNSKYRSHIFGFSSVQSSKVQYNRAEGNYVTMGDSLPLNLPLNGAMNDETYNFLLRGEVDIPKNLLINIMESAISTKHNTDFEMHYTQNNIGESTKKKMEPKKPEDETAISMMVQIFSDGVIETSEIRENLESISLFAQHHHLVHPPRNISVDDACLSNNCLEMSEVDDNEGKFHGFDWFPPTILYALFDGDLAKTKTFLVSIKNLECAPCLWPFSYQQPTVQDGAIEGFLLGVIGHNVEMIIQAESKRRGKLGVLKSWNLSSFPILCRRWIRQAFLNSGLDFSEIQYYVLSVILMGPEYSVYFCASAIQYILSRQNESNADKNIFLCTAEDVMIPLHGFKAIEHLPYMKELQSRYREFVSKDIRKGINTVLNR